METLPVNLKIQQTRDGSPTLEWRRADGYAESMHHSGGALGESIYIYHAALEEVRERGWETHVLSVGLGLGYNELIAIATLIDGHDEDWRLWSFEASAFLRDSFRAWLRPEKGISPLNLVYDQVLKGVAEYFDLEPGVVKRAAGRALLEGRWEIRGAFPDEAGGVVGSSCVFYDAFSKQMALELWRESLLTETLRKVIGPRCLVASYAAIGPFKRALKSLGFRLRPKKGFCGRRESTLAIRE